MSNSDLHLVRTTFPERQQAEQVARLLVDAGLAVWAQVGAELTSFSQQGGSVRQTAEVAVMFEVLAGRFDLFMGELKLQHPLAAPQLVSWRVAK